MILVGKNELMDFSVYFNANYQTYSVYKGNKFLIGNKYRFADIQSYLN